MTERTTDQSDTEAQELVLTRVFDAPRELVFKAWTEPERYVRWCAPNGFTIPACKIDLRPGGRIRYCMRSPEGQDFWCGGVYREIVPPERIVLTDYFADEQGNPVSPTVYGMSAGWPEEGLITVTLTERDGKTTLTMRQTVGGSVEDRNGAEQGWGECFDRLAAYLAQA